MKYLKNLTALNAYLEERKDKGREAFKSLFRQAEEEKAELLVLSFTYENIEVYAKVTGNFKLYQHFFSVLSQAEMDEITQATYDDADVYEDFIYWQFYELAGEFVKLWLVSCFAEARKSYDSFDDTIKYYYKENHDSMEILGLNDCSRKLEESEFSTYVKNNQRNLITLLR